jgi:hypothetical protein
MTAQEAKMLVINPIAGPRAEAHGLSKLKCSPALSCKMVELMCGAHTAKTANNGDL